MTFEAKLEDNDPCVLAEHFIEDAKWKAEHRQLEAALIQLDKANEILDVAHNTPNPLIEATDLKRLRNEIDEFRIKYET